MSPFRPMHLGLIALAVCQAASTSAQTVLYRETFGRAEPTGNQGTVGWDWIRFNAAGALGSIANGISGDGEGGKPIDLANTPSAGPNADGTTDAYPEGWAYMDGSLRLDMTTEYTFDPGTAGPITFSWYQGANYNNPEATPGLNEARVAVRVGGAWYVSSQFFTNTPVTSGANFGLPDPEGGELKSLAFNPAPANWLTLMFDGDYNVETNEGTPSTVALAMGEPPTGALAGPITAFGLYRDGTPPTGNFNFRFDTFTITGGGGGGMNSANFDNANGVDGHDFLIWQRGLGMTTGATKASGDANGDGAVNAADLTIWRSTFGTAGVGAAAGAVPEPSGLALLTIAGCGLLRRRRHN